jgi:hypothetical protein
VVRDGGLNLVFGPPDRKVANRCESEGGMMEKTQPPDHNGHAPAIDFSGRTRGKLHVSNAGLNIPVYLDGPKPQLQRPRAA